jgi:hypothetical protein
MDFFLLFSGLSFYFILLFLLYFKTLQPFVHIHSFFAFFFSPLKQFSIISSSMTQISYRRLHGSNYKLWIFLFSLISQTDLILTKKLLMMRRKKKSQSWRVQNLISTQQRDKIFEIFSHLSSVWTWKSRAKKKKN